MVRFRLGNRYYDPEAGRFLSKDPIKDGDNWYAYCDNNPLSGVDPDGLQAEHTGGNNWDKHSGRRAGEHNNSGKGKGGYDDDNPKNPPQDERRGPPDRRLNPNPDWNKDGGRRQGGGDRRKVDKGRPARTKDKYTPPAPQQPNPYAFTGSPYQFGPSGQFPISQDAMKEAGPWILGGLLIGGGLFVAPEITVPVFGRLLLKKAFGQ